MIRDHKVEVERLGEKKEFEKERALLEVEKEYQSKLIQVNEAHNEKLQELYAEISGVR
ncbi:hypothetical protein [Bacillus sp. FJAT-52991]|uniref:Uncharacterized protein n=1 Tax=Bacillus kandeliae TaxID=3129297 RepID=A0ABZ2NBG3_9BACI